MPLQDVSNDESMIGWLRQAGHGHLLNDQHQYANLSSSPSLPIISAGQTHADNYHDSYNRSTSFSNNANINCESYDSHQTSANFAPPPTQFHAPYMDQYRTDVDIEVRKEKSLNLIDYLTSFST